MNLDKDYLMWNCKICGKRYKDFKAVDWEKVIRPKYRLDTLCHKCYSKEKLYVLGLSPIKRWLLFWFGELIHKTFDDEGMIIYFAD